MAQSEPNFLEEVRTLLREGRVNEADKRLNEEAERLRQEAERKKSELPPPAPRSAAELLVAELDEIIHFLGNQPRMVNLLEEYKAEALPKPEPH